jgi:hypothetical protein
MQKAEANHNGPRPTWHLPIAVGVWTAIGVAALFVHFERWVLGSEAASEFRERLLVFGAAIAVSAMALRGIPARRSAASSIGCSLAAVAAPLLLFLALAPVQNPREVAIWSLLGGLAVLGLARHTDVTGPASEDTSATIVDSSIPPFEPVEPLSCDATASFPPEDEPTVPRSATHSTERVVDEHGETMSGHALVRFEPGRRLAAVHVPFTPVFARAPHCEAEIEEGDATAKVTASRAYGTRIEVRRSAASAPGEVRLAWSAWLPPAAEVSEAA